MKKIFLISILFLQSCLIGSGFNSDVAGKNGYFPELTGIDLDGSQRKLPNDFNNEFNLVVVAFKREQQIEVDSWIKAIEPMLKEKTNLSFFEVPLIYELSTFKRFWINNGMRFGIPDELARKRTITVYTDRKQFFGITKMEENKIYALLINKEGKILYKIEGVADNKKIEELKKFLTKK